MKAVVAAFYKEKALVGAFSVITNLRMDLFEALEETQHKTKQIYHLLSPARAHGHTAAASTNLRREVVMVILVLVSIDWLELLFLLTIQ